VGGFLLTAAVGEGAGVSGASVTGSAAGWVDVGLGAVVGVGVRVRVEVVGGT